MTPQEQEIFDGLAVLNRRGFDLVWNSDRSLWFLNAFDAIVMEGFHTAFDALVFLAANPAIGSPDDATKIAIQREVMSPHFPRIVRDLIEVHRLENQ